MYADKYRLKPKTGANYKLRECQSWTLILSFGTTLYPIMNRNSGLCQKYRLVPF